MRFTSYGRDVIIKVVVIGMVLMLAAYFTGMPAVKFIVLGIVFFFWIFTFYFFRDPERKLPAGYKANQVISPGDGKIVIIEDVKGKGDFFAAGEELKQVSIFLSPLNVHVNRIPISGIVKYLKYIKGEYIVAFDHKSSDRNERSEIGIEDMASGNKVFFKQIAGFVARRIVYDIKEGDIVKAGERFGMIKFGSRVDILMKRECKVLVKMDQMVTGGETIIAEL